MAPGTRPNPNVGNGVTWFDEGTSSYHSLNVSLTKRASHGLTFKASYTYAKVMDLNSAILAPSANSGALRGPHLTNVDTSLFKKIAITERLNVQFRAEIFNLFNHANYQEPNAIVFSGAGASSSAGQILSTATFSRQIPLALKFNF